MIIPVSICKKNVRSLSWLFSTHPSVSTLHPSLRLLCGLHSWPSSTTSIRSLGLQTLTSFSLREASVETVRGECNWGIYSPETSLLGLRLVTFNPPLQVLAQVRSLLLQLMLPTSGKCFPLLPLRTQGWWWLIAIAICEVLPHPCGLLILPTPLLLVPSLNSAHVTSFSEWSFFPAGATTNRGLRWNLKDLGQTSHCPPILRNSKILGTLHFYILWSQRARAKNQNQKRQRSFLIF